MIDAQIGYLRRRRAPIPVPHQEGDAAQHRDIAEADPALALRVAALGDAKAGPSARGQEPKKRGRPRKGDGDANLFGAVEGTTFESVEAAAE